ASSDCLHRHPLLRRPNRAAGRPTPGASAAGHWWATVGGRPHLRLLPGSRPARRPAGDAATPGTPAGPTRSLHARLPASLPGGVGRTPGTSSGGGGHRGTCRVVADAYHSGGGYRPPATCP